MSLLGMCVYESLLFLGLLFLAILNLALILFTEPACLGSEAPVQSSQNPLSSRKIPELKLYGWMVL
jgi:hypothetical protein